MKALVILVLVTVAGYFAYLQLSPHDEVWLHGKWKYGGQQHDFMTFNKDGSVELSNAKGVYARCIYASVVADKVSMECKVKGKSHELHFKATNDSKTLTNINRSDSVYHKVGA